MSPYISPGSRNGPRPTNTSRERLTPVSGQEKQQEVLNLPNDPAVLGALRSKVGEGSKGNNNSTHPNMPNPIEKLGGMMAQSVNSPKELSLRDASVTSKDGNDRSQGGGSTNPSTPQGINTGYRSSNSNQGTPIGMNQPNAPQPNKIQGGYVPQQVRPQVVNSGYVPSNLPAPRFAPPMAMTGATMPDGSSRIIPVQPMGIPLAVYPVTPIRPVLAGHPPGHLPPNIQTGYRPPGVPPGAIPVRVLPPNPSTGYIPKNGPAPTPTNPQKKSNHYELNFPTVTEGLNPQHVALINKHNENVQNASGKYRPGNLKNKDPRYQGYRKPGTEGGEQNRGHNNGNKDMNGFWGCWKFFFHRIGNDAMRKSVFLNPPPITTNTATASPTSCPTEKNASS